MRGSMLDAALRWCAAMLGPVRVASDHSKAHGDHESTTCRIQTRAGFCYLKLHQSEAHWQNEVHAYERWAGVFGRHAPQLLGAHADAPLALVVTEVPGRIMEHAELPVAVELAAWRAAGAALTPLHTLATGACFGPCRRDGSCAEDWPRDALDCMTLRLDRLVDRALRGGYINDTERAVVDAAYADLAAFAGERPVPCHRDYCAANWLVGADGVWSGVIDFEFAYWDVRVADFARDPNWSWIHRPELFAALFEGYGRALSAREARQLRVARVEYALGAILWGRDHEFFGFEREGREALAYLSE